jgi:hypothetical protein
MARDYRAVKITGPGRVLVSEQSPVDLYRSSIAVDYSSKKH